MWELFDAYLMNEVHVQVELLENIEARLQQFVWKVTPMPPGCDSISRGANCFKPFFSRRGERT